jgi:hypothetical protein
MALYPYTNKGKDILQPGARGEMFKSDLPGFRGGEDRINRSNMNLSTSEHDVPNIKWEFDRRLPVLFRYGYAIGYNQIVIPKGRICAIDPYMNQLDFDTHKALNVVTLANGGNVVKLRETGDFAGKQYEPVTGNYVTAAGNEQIYRTGTVVPTETIAIDPEGGKVTVDGAINDNYRPANKPIGILQRNEYTRDDDAFNGMQPGAILTDAMVELPLFAIKEKAEANPWGSIYGNILPGDYVKSDENGRFVVSPLSRPEILATMEAHEIELERQQIVGQVYNVQRDLLPAGAARFAQWALSDRMNFDQYNPFMWRGNNRKNEDINEYSPYNKGAGGSVNTNKEMTGKDPFTGTGYEYDQTMTQHDLHMLASSARKSDLRFGLEHQLDNGIPGLTDGYNAVTREFGIENIGDMKKASDKAAYVDQFFKMSEVGIEEGTVKVAITTKSKDQLTDADFTNVTMAGQGLKAYINTAYTASEVITVKYINEKQGFIVLTVSDVNEFHDSALTADQRLNVYVKFNKRGLTGVPTFMDWDGCTGFASILLQK